MKIFSTFLLLCLISFGTLAQEYQGSFEIRHNDDPESQTDESFNTSFKVVISGNKVAMIPLTLDGEENAQFAKMIMDTESNTWTMCMKRGGRKMAIVIENPSLSLEDEEKSNEEIDVAVRKTGETREIENFKCEEIEVESEESLTSVWVTDELEINFSQMMNMMFYEGANPGSGDQNTQENPYEEMDMDGTPLDIYSVEKESGETFKTMFRNFSDKIDEEAFDLEGYQVINMKNMQDMMND